MPKEVFGRDFQFLEREELLTFEKITRLARVFVACGVRKIRVTEGEPLVRRNVERLIQQLAGIEGLRDLTMTTNGALLVSQARTLCEAGLRRVTVSLDSLEDDVFKAMNDVGFPVARVVEGIDAAARAALTPVKVNMVVKRGVKDHNPNRAGRLSLCKQPSWELQLALGIPARPRICCVAQGAARDRAPSEPEQRRRNRAPQALQAFRLAD